MCPWADRNGYAPNASRTERGAPLAGRVDILGVQVSAINMQMALETIHNWITSRQPNYVCVTGVHGVMESQRDERLREIHNRAGLVTPDGMPLVWISRLMGFAEVDRVYGPDLMLAVCRRSLSTGYRHFFFGGVPGVAESLAARLGRRFPGLKVKGWYSPSFQPLDADEMARAAALINSADPDIVWVGLSTQKQEHWMAAASGALSAPVLIGCGAAFDFLSGIRRQAPRWMRRAGLEWLFRLLSEPRRLGPRYLVNNPQFVRAVARQMLREWRYRGGWRAGRNSG
jgi:N-acetylglucosaminyldiphosphoundecaprenol N-acetyl-beta-D-mannosaminyltransferase